MTDEDGLLHRLIDALDDWRGWSVYRTLDFRGPYAVVTRHRDAGAFVAVCKRQRHNGDVSVMRRAVDAAARADDRVAVFVGKKPKLGRAYAFDPERLCVCGRAFTIESKQGVSVEAIQIDPDAHGAVLGDVVSGRVAVPEAGVAERTTQGRLGKLGGERA